jgi:hypothetical protein
MASEARLVSNDRRDEMLGVPLPPRVRLNVRSVEEPEPDNLRQARGVLLGALLGAGTWAMIGFIVWLINR